MSDTPDTDWRLRGQEQYLTGVRLVRRRWAQTQEGWDHDHCEFCWAKFAGSNIADALREGWTTLDEYRWICDECFTDFHVQFGWKTED